MMIFVFGWSILGIALFGFYGFDKASEMLLCFVMANLNLIQHHLGIFKKKVDR